VALVMLTTARVEAYTHGKQQVGKQKLHPSFPVQHEKSPHLLSGFAISSARMSAASNSSSN
jgi:hypothetical protein